MTGYGKIFGSMYTGSMLGAGPVVFAVWAYVIANVDRNSRLEINPALLAAMIGCDVEDVESALVYLTSPDPSSRSEAEEGRRLLYEGGFTYFVVNYKEYREKVSKVQNAERQQAYRNKQKAEMEAKKAAPKPKAKKVQETVDYTGEFVAFWETSWKRGSKRGAFDTWMAMEPEQQLEAMDVVAAWTKAFEQRDAQRRPHVTTWLNNRGWDDVVDAEYGTGKGAVDKTIESKYSKFD